MMPGSDRSLVSRLSMSADLPDVHFSLVVATLGRTQELVRLFESLSHQTRRDFEVIVVDQNTDERLAPVVARFAATLDIRHLRTDRRGVCRARNLGADAARAPWLVFPDDDCWYPADFLERMAGLIAASGADFCCGRPTDAAGRTIMGTFETEAMPIARGTIWTTLIEWMLAVRRTPFLAAHGFDERIGPGSGTPWGAYEVQDLVLTLLASGAKGYYDPALTGHHPEDASDQTTAANVAKMRTDSAGLGYVMQKHGYGFRDFLPRLLRPIAGMGVYALTGRPGMARRSREILLGRWQGWRQARAARP